MNPITLTYDTEHELNLDLYLPEAENPPLFIYMHGGGIENGNRRERREVFKKLSDSGIACASLDYRMYKNAKFPEFIEDCANGIHYLLQECSYRFSKVTVGGSSAGAYLSMMLLFDPHYLGKYGLDPLQFDGWLLDAGQPTVHFNVLRERGLDTRLVRVDEAAPIYFVDHDFAPHREDSKLPFIYNVSSSKDMTCRLEQLKLLNATLLHFKWQPSRLRFIYQNGYGHCGYPIGDMIVELLRNC